MWFIIVLLGLALIYYWVRIAMLEAQRKALLNSLSSALLSKGETPELLVQDFLDNLSSTLPVSDYNVAMKALAIAVQADTYKDKNGVLVIKQKQWLKENFVRDINYTKKQLESEADELDY
jgi:hypothetical protein